MIEEIEKEGLTLMHLRKVPVNTDILGKDARDTEPDIKQVFITGCDDQQVLELKLYIIRKRIEKRMAASDIPNRKDFYVASLSTKSIIYKGMLESMQLRHYFPDLTNPYLTSGLALVHSRFSTNTFPTWSLAQPFRLLAHNGEINTIRGNRGWMEARESVLSSPRIPNIDEIRPIIQPDMSDSASLDNVLEFFVASGMSLPHAMAMLVPESFNEKTDIGRPESVLRIPFYPDGTVGWPGRPALQRRTVCRRNARPQRLAPGTLPDHEKRHDGRGVRSGRNGLRT